MDTERTYSPADMLAFGIEMIDYGMTTQHYQTAGTLDPKANGEALQTVLRKWGLAEHVVTEVPEP